MVQPVDEPHGTLYSNIMLLETGACTVCLTKRADEKNKCAGHMRRWGVVRFGFLHRRILCVQGARRQRCLARQPRAPDRVPVRVYEGRAEKSKEEMQKKRREREHTHHTGSGRTHTERHESQTQQHAQQKYVAGYTLDHPLGGPGMESNSLPGANWPRKLETKSRIQGVTSAKHASGQTSVHTWQHTTGFVVQEDTNHNNSQAHSSGLPHKSRVCSRGTRWTTRLVGLAWSQTPSRGLTGRENSRPSRGSRG